MIAECRAYHPLTGLQIADMSCSAAAAAVVIQDFPPAVKSLGGAAPCGHALPSAGNVETKKTSRSGNCKRAARSRAGRRLDHGYVRYARGTVPPGLWGG